MKARNTFRGTAVALLLGGALVLPAALGAQGPEGRWPLQPTSEIGRVVAPFLEGWYVNEDGTVSYSFGYLNLNGDTVEIPVGERNNIEPARFHGMQPTVFLPGRHRGMFAVTVPAEMRDADVWWRITNDNGEVTQVPGRTRWSAYTLDWNPRPHGSVTPMVSFEGSSDVGRGPPGIISGRTLTATVGQPLEVAVNVHDPSVRDRSDARFKDDIPVRVVFSKYQGPVGGGIEFTRHPSTPPDPPSGRGRRGGGGAAAAAAAAAAGGGGAGRGVAVAGGAAQAGGDNPGAGAHIVNVATGSGTARVMVTFSAPGEYILNAQADNFGVPDSSSGDQCCWTNGYVRVTVR
jgi:hypothetical protein